MNPTMPQQFCQQILSHKPAKYLRLRAIVLRTSKNLRARSPIVPKITPDMQKSLPYLEPRLSQLEIEIEVEAAAD